MELQVASSRDDCAEELRHVDPLQVASHCGKPHAWTMPRRVSLQAGCVVRGGAPRSCRADSLQVALHPWTFNWGRNYAATIFPQGAAPRGPPTTGCAAPREGSTGLSGERRGRHYPP